MWLTQRGINRRHRQLLGTVVFAPDSPLLAAARDFSTRQVLEVGIVAAVAVGAKISRRANGSQAAIRGAELKPSQFGLDAWENTGQRDVAGPKCGRRHARDACTQVLLSDRSGLAPKQIEPRPQFVNQLATLEQHAYLDASPDALVGKV